MNSKRGIAIAALGVAGIAAALWLAPKGGLLSCVNTDVSDKPRVEIVHIQGELGNGAARSLTQQIAAACRAATRDVVLDINSPGGSPSQAYRIHQAVRHCRSRAGQSKNVEAFVTGEATSAAYLIAAAAESVTADPFAEIGSVGIVSRQLDLSEAASRAGIREIAVRSGPRKALASPWVAAPPQEQKDRQAFVDAAADVFLKQVIEDRRGAIKISREDLATGRTWIAAQAMEAGLIDRIGTLEDAKATRWADAQIHDAGGPDTPAHTEDPLARRFIASLFQSRRDDE